ncbi:MAG: hypothetical protein MO853_01685 [Candidatus Protistobacter heckmanni]|nr:hypothetical protein [Candidatus Protistobacter heckmanni]
MKLNFAQRCLTKAAIAIASGMLFAGAVHAQPAPAPQDAPQAAPGGWHRHGGDPSARVQRRLDDLKKKLNIKPEQESAWSTYAASVTARTRSASRCTSRCAPSGRPAPRPSPRVARQSAWRRPRR